MSERILILSREKRTTFKAAFKTVNEKIAEIGFVRSFVYESKKETRTRILLTLDQIAEFRKNLEWLEGELLLQEKSYYDNPVDRDYESYGDGEC